VKHSSKMLAFSMLCALAACGQNPQERTTGGAAAGAASGAAVGALAGPPGMAVGALVGGGAGAVAGATTKPKDVNLGRPPWTNPETRVPTPDGPVAPARSSSRSSGTSQNAEVDRLNQQSLDQARSAR